MHLLGLVSPPEWNGTSRHGVRAWLGLAELALANGGATQALNDAEQGLARVDDARTKVHTIARAKFLVTQALRETTPGKRPQRALTQASEAAELLHDRAETDQRAGHHHHHHHLA